MSATPGARCWVLAVGLAFFPATRHPASNTFLHTVDVVAGDYFFSAPDTIPAGMTEFRVRNAGGHHVMLISRLDSGKTLADQMALARPAAPWVTILSGPVTGDSGGIAIVVLDMTPGRYSLFCYFNDADGTGSHARKGMARELIIRGPMPPAEPEPAADVEVTLTDYDFALSRPVTPGVRTIRFENSSAHPHEVIIQRLLAGKHLADWIAARAGGGPPAGTNFGGVGALPRGHILLRADFAPGSYVWYCAIRDADRVSHVEKGMVKEMTVE